ncbi:TetR/AcrR family transcriptional regulator [Streptomyces sp. NRRL F-7442]|uniref:TetR/AcrR family transcriptional regulator n=1 Tax=Streptomyces sp. NRRL F-7442 TaxID=1519498 RepID=UPI0006AED068|nr:TetR/AcrR family transcriptional regulator [Streptomyces sp. NRRL F-7442]KOX46320.1 TetR family transcriptional regulator [Streptomyces sp. NRRL F-7442]
MSPRTEAARTPSAARTRLLGTATRIFYAEGIHSVGIDRITTEAQVTRATLYRHFAGKEDLVLAYLDQADRGIREQVAAAVDGTPSAAGQVRAVARSVVDGIRSPGFRGCAFLNAVAEYPDPAHPVHRAVLAHREWFLRTVTELLTRAGEGDAPAEAAGRHLVMLRDGAMAAGCLFDPDLVSETFLHGVEGLLRDVTEKTSA